MPVRRNFWQCFGGLENTKKFSRHYVKKTVPLQLFCDSVTIIFTFIITVIIIILTVKQCEAHHSR